MAAKTPLRSIFPPAAACLLFAACLGSVSTAALADTRTGQIGVSATVVNSCRIAVPAEVQAREASRPVHQSHCSGTMAVATRAVVESASTQDTTLAEQRARHVAFTYPDAQASPSAARWIRYDVYY